MKGSFEMLRYIIFGIFGVIIYLIWKRTMERLNSFKKSQMKGGAKKTFDMDMSELVQDPVCKLYIAKESAIFYKEHYFCSEKCKKDFRG